MKMNVAQVLVRYLKERGVSHVFGVSAHSTFDITDAIYQEPGIDFVPAQIEVAAGYMANGYSRGIGGLAVNLVSSGGGATNAVSGVGQAYKDSLPVLTISSDVDRAHAHKGASSWHEIPQREMFAPLTKMSVTLERAEDIFEVLDDAVRSATTGRNGPVYLGVPRDIQVEEIEVPDGAWGNGQPVPAREPEARLIAQAAEVLARATAPIIIAGGGVRTANAEAELLELAQFLGAPIGVTTSHKGLISENHPLAIGVLGSAAAPYANKFSQEADVILAVGTTFSEPTTLGYGNQVIPQGAKIVHVDIDPAEIGKVYPVEVGIAGDAKPALRALIAQLKAAGRTSSTPARLERLRDEKQAWRAEMTQRGQMTDGPINQWQLYGELRKAIDEDAIVVAEGGTQELIYRFVATSLIYHGGEFRPIGHGLGTSLGLKCAFPDRQVVSVSGDGSFMMELQELATAMRANLPITVVVVHNGAYGNMKRDQIRHYDGRVIGTDLYIPDLPKLADAFGVYGARVEKPAELAGAIRGALASKRPALVDVVCPIEGI